MALEAWAGLPAQRALDTAREVMRDASPEPETSAGALPEHRDEPGALVEAHDVPDDGDRDRVLGHAARRPRRRDAVGRGVMLALPVTLGLQWGLSSRYFGPRARARALGGRPRPRGRLVAVARGAGWLALLGEAGLIAGLLTVTWVGGTVLVQCRRWPRRYAAGILLTTVALLAGPAPLAVLARARRRGRSPRRWRCARRTRRPRARARAGPG